MYILYNNFLKKSICNFFRGGHALLTKQSIPYLVRNDRLHHYDYQLYLLAGEVRFELTRNMRRILGPKYCSIGLLSKPYRWFLCVYHFRHSPMLFFWLRGWDSNPRLSAYEADVLPLHNPASLYSDFR